MRTTQAGKAATRPGALCLALWIVAWAAPVPAIELGQVDDFQDATTQGWSHGLVSPNPPVNIATGGPAGAGDRYLEVRSADVLTAGSRFVAFNTAQWGGDYLAAGVTGIELWAQNTGDSALSLRVAVTSFGGGSTYGSVSPVVIPAFGGWRLIEFSLGANSLSCAEDIPICTEDLENALKNVTELRIVSAVSGPQLTGDKHPAQGGFDDITAVPEPLGLQPLALASLVLLARLRAKRLTEERLRLGRRPLRLASAPHLPRPR